MKEIKVDIKQFALRNYSAQLTVKEVVEEYCDRPQIRASTRLCLSYLFKRWLQKYYDIPVLRVRNKEVREVIKNIDSYVCTRNKTPITPNSKWSVLTNINALFRFAEKQGYIPVNPFGGLKYRYVKKAAKHLSPDEVKILINSEFPDDEFRAAVLLALCAGLRRGEVIGLRWSDVNLDSRTLTIRRSSLWLYGRWYDNQPKNNRERVIPINDVLYDALHTLYSKERIDGQVVHIAPFRLTAGFPKYAQSIGIRRYKFHDLRRTFGTIMLQKGVDLKTCSTLLGHSDIAVTSDFYLGIIDEMSRKAVCKLDDV